jgi:hypothetical protein
VVVATAIFSVTVVSLLVVRSRAIEQTGRARNYRTARRLTMQFLEELLGGKEYEEGESGAFDPENHPDFYWRMKKIEKIELKESELPFLQDPKGQQPPGAGGDTPAAAPGGPPGGGGLAALLGGGAGAGMGDELVRYVVEVAYPVKAEPGTKRFEVVTYYMKEPDQDALSKILGGAPGGPAGADPASGGGLGSLLRGGR